VGNKIKKGSSEGKMKIRNNEEIESKNETIEMRNRFSALETDDEIQTSEQKKNKCENLPRIITSMPKTNTNQNKQECINTASPQKELQTREEMRPNLKSNCTTPRQHNTKGTNETYKIPTIINGRVPWEVSDRTPVKRLTSLRDRKSHTEKRYTTRIHKNHNLLLIGDSHTRGLAERIGCSLGNSFSVIGITKPNADIKGITSPGHFTSVNLTKHDTIVFCGGTRDISRNETKNGLRSLKEFAQKTSNINIILLEAPLRYDLPLSSCVNTEVKLFNKRMRSLMTPFSYVKVVSTPTEREHHTRHGLHLSKKGKHWIADNLVKEIRNVYCPLKKNPPIVIKWKDIKRNTTQQANQATSTKMDDEMEPPGPDEKRSDGWIRRTRGDKDEEESKQHPTQTSEQTQTIPPQQVKIQNRVSNRQKKMPATKSDDFLW
jgi:hypothetical protein